MALGAQPGMQEAAQRPRSRKHITQSASGWRTARKLPLLQHGDQLASRDGLFRNGTVYFGGGPCPEDRDQAGSTWADCATGNRGNWEIKYAVDDCTVDLGLHGQGHRVDSDVASRDACIAECETFLGTNERSGEHGYMIYESGKKECFCYTYSDADPLEITCNKVLFKGPAIIDGSAFFEDQIPSTNVVISGGMPYDSHMDAMNHAACTASSGGTGLIRRNRNRTDADVALALALALQRVPRWAGTMLGRANYEGQ